MTREFCEPFGLAWIVMAGGMPEVLGDWCGDQGASTWFAEAFHGSGEPMEAGSTARDVWSTGFCSFVEGMIIDAELRWIGQCVAALLRETLISLNKRAFTSHQKRLKIFRQRRASKSFKRDFHPDTGGITKGDDQPLVSVR